MDASQSDVALSRKEFNRNRKIVLRNVPGITIEEVKEFLGEYKAKNILISKKFKHAVVTLKDETASEAAVAALNGKSFHNCKVEVKFNPCNRLLCVGNLPASMQRADFQALVQSYGPVDRCFLMHNIGASKQNGFVEFSKTDEINEICRQLDGKILKSGTEVVCDVVLASVVDFEQLYASCLYVKHLPPDFTDDSLLQEKFSVIAKPLYCRVARKDEKPVGFAIVEFADGATADRTCRLLENLIIGGQQVELEMCVPGHTVPEAFSRQMSLLKSTKTVHARVMKRLPSKLYNVPCKTPVVDPKLLPFLKENSVSMLNNFKKLLMRLEQCQLYEQHRIMSDIADEPGLLGVVPWDKPSVYAQLNVQCAVLSVYLAAVAQQMIPCVSTPLLLQLLPPDCNVKALMYNPMIMQASCTMYSLVSFCKGENESDLQPVIYPISTPLVSEDYDDADLMAMHQGRKSRSLIQMLGSLPGGIGTLVDITKLLTTMHKALCSQMTDNQNSETSSAEADGTSSSEQSGILGPPPLMSCKPHQSSSHSVFAFNHLLASHIQAQLLQKISMPPRDEPVPPEARLPIASLGSVVSLFDLPLIRPLVAKSMQKSAAEQSSDSSQADVKPVSTSTAPLAAPGDGILGRPPVPRFQGPMAPRGISGNAERFRGPAVRPFMGRNFAGASNWPRPRADMVSAMAGQRDGQSQWTGSWNSSSNKSGACWRWTNEPADNVSKGQQWDTGSQPDWASYSRQSSVRPAGNLMTPPHRPPVGQSAPPSMHEKPPQMPRFNRPPPPQSISMPSSGPWSQYSKDPSGWQPNQPGVYSSYTTGAEDWSDTSSSAAVPWQQSNQQNSAPFTSQSSGTFSAPSQFLANQSTASGYQQQNSSSSQVTQQSSTSSGNAYSWDNNTSASQWPSQSQWSWPQSQGQWPSSQPLQYASGSTNTSVATSSSGNVATDSYGSYGTNAWPGNTGSGYNMGGYDMSSMYNSYTQMYEQYYGSQVMPTAGAEQQQKNVGAMCQPPPANAYSNVESYSTPGQKRAAPDTMNEALAAFYGDDQGSTKRTRFS